MANCLKSFLAGGLIMLVCFFTSCDVGLGESVDTVAPSVEITYPPANSVIRGAFEFAGTCSDDKGVSSVSVTVLGTDRKAVRYTDLDGNSKEYAVPAAKVENDGKTWHILINEQISEGAYPLSDGTYICKVQAKDSSGRTSDWIERSFEIDNTEPVFIISSPAVTDTANATEYGSVFKISGKIADDHDIRNMNITVYDKDGNKINGEDVVWTFTNVDTAGGMSITAARYFTKSGLSAAEQTLHNNYINIYGEGYTGDKIFTCTVELEDAAQEWVEPVYKTDQQPENTARGNVTTSLWLNDDIYEELMGANSAYQLEAGGIKKIWNGTDDEPAVLSILQDKRKNTAETKLAFSLNKKAEPTYSIGGYDMTGADFSGNSAAKNGKVTFMANAGRNGIQVDPSTFTLYLFGPFEPASVDEAFINGLYSKPAEKYNQYHKEQDSQAEILYSGVDYKKGSVEAFTQTVTLPESITNGSRYIFAATGSDLDGLTLETSEGTFYGFTGIAAGTPPQVTISFPDDDAVIKSSEGLFITGTASSTESKIKEISYEITVYDYLKKDSGGNYIKVGTVTGFAEAVENTRFGDASVKYSCDVSKGTFVSADKNAYPSANPSAETDDGNGQIFVYEIVVVVRDDSASESNEKRRIYLDNAKPVPLITNVDPVAEKQKDENGNIVEKKINGTVTISGKVSEKNLKSLVLTVKDSAEKTKPYTYSEASFEEKIDTTLFSDGEVEFTLTAVDEAGTKSIIKEVYTIDQSTDKPVIKFSNGKSTVDGVDDFSKVVNGQNIFGVENNNKAVFNFTDDDGLDQITITLCDENGNVIDASKGENVVQVQENQTGENAKPENPVVYTFGGTTTALINYILPQKEGKYILDIEVTDVEYNNVGKRQDAETVRSYRKSTAKNYIVVSESNFVMKFADSKIVNDECEVKLEDTTVEGTISVTDLDKIKSIERYTIVQNESGVSEKKVLSFYKKDESGGITISLPENSSKVRWTETIPAGQLTEGENHFYYFAEDVTGNHTELELTCYADNTPPYVHSHSDTYKIVNVWLNSTSQTLTFIIQDEAINGYASGIDSVKYSFKNGENNTTEGNFARGASCDENGNTNQNGAYTLYKTTFDLPEGESNLVTVTVADRVGNTSSAELNLKIDTNAPVVSVTPSITGGQILQNTKDVPVTFAYKDATSGIQKVELATNSNMQGAVPLTGDKIVSPYKYSLSGLSDGKHTIYVRATDNAGNKSEVVKAGEVIVDTTAPKVEIKTPVSGATVNKTISFAGMVTDNNLPDGSVPVLWYNDGTKWHDVSGVSTSLTNQEWTITGVDTTKLYNNDTENSGKTFDFCVVFTDKAGNTNNFDTGITLKIDQNADRPEIKLTNINTTGSSISSNLVQGVISDDDGVSTKGGVKLYRIDSADYDADSETNKTPSTSGNKWKPIPVEAGTGIWKAEIAEAEGQGSKHWYFYVIDEAGGEFCTKAASSLERPYLTDGSNEKTDNQTGITFFFDTTAPTVKISLSEDGINYSTTNTIFGGSKDLYVRAEVFEEVGMAEKTATKAPAVLYIGGVKQEKNTPTVIQNGNTYTYKFNSIALSGYPADKPLSVSVTAEDSAGNTNKDILNITIDKDAPTVKIISPTTALSDAVSSSVSIKGIVQDDKSSIAKLEYVIPKNGVEDASQEWKAMGTAASWDITFASGAPDSSDSLIYYAVAENASGGKVYQVEVSGTENIYKVPLWFKVSDSAGNKAIVKDQYVLVDSEGGKPKAWINSPENNATTSGVVTIYGGASDNVSVSKVCVQIDANNDGNFNADDATYINNSWESDKDELKSTIAGSGDDWYIPASGTNSWKLNVDTNCISENSGSKTLRIRVKAIDDEGLSRAWSDPVIVNIDSETPVIKNLKLVQYGKDEMPTDSTSPVTEREYVSGMYISNISAQNNGQWYLTGDVSDNVSVSSITFEMITSSTQNNIRLEDGSEIKPGAASYKLRVPLKTDESGVISYAIKAKDNNTGEATVSITINIDSTSPSLYNTSNTETLKPGTSLRLKSMSKTLGTGEENSTVVNNNNFFTFGDVVSESGSGLAYTAFYFERDGSSEKRVYNPMFNSGNKNVIDAESFTAGKVYINGDGLAALCVIDSSRKSEDSITLSSANANIRKGGLIKIAGGYSLITEVSGTTVKFSPTASTTFKQAELILAQVVDHKITESVGSDGKTVVNDDGDEMIETINQIGSSYNWTASIDSNNIPDGPVTIHVVAIDNAGNSTHGSIATKVENNRPRIAKVLLGTDLNDSGKYDFVADSAPVTTGDNEKDTKDGKAFGEFSYFTALDSNSGKAKSEVTLTSSAFKVIKGLCIIPEFVGGNNGLGYILENPSDLSNAGYETGSVSSMTTKDGILANVNSTGIYQIDNEISRFGGIELTSLTSGNISITFWDKTEETVQGTNSQWALLKIPVTLMTDEKESPVPVINPFYWKDSTDNSVYIDGKIKGHIELEGDLTNDIIKSLGNDPKVSGKIKIEGTVTDNVRISSVKMSFASLFAEQQLASYTKGVWNISSLPQGVEKFEIEDVYISQEGHKAKYILVVDTEKLTGVTGKDKAITISATDWTDSNTSAAVSYTVDVVPYVTEIVTNLSSYSMDNPSVYARSSVGSYPVYEGEEIEIKGYNIGEGIASVAMNGKTVTLNSSNKLTVDSNVSSGTVSVSVEGISAVNNLNKNDAIGSYSGSASDNDYANCYNRQPNGVNNNLLTDDLSLDVWNFKTAASPIGSSANYVHMKVGPYLSNDSANSGRIGFSFKNAIGYFNMPGQKSGNSYTVTNNSVDLYVNSSLDYIAIHHWGNSDKNKTEVPISLGSAVSYKGGSYYHISFSSSDLDITSSGDTTLQFLLTKKVGDYTDKTGDCMITRVGCYVIDSVPNGTINPTTEYRTSTVGNKVFSQTRFGTNYGGFNHNTFAFDKNGYTYGAAQCPDTSGKDGMSANFQFFSRAVSDESSDYHGLNFNYFNVTNGRRIENTSYYKDSTVYTDENRVQNPEMATYVSESTSYVYLAYYDHGLDMIKFRVGSVGSSANSIGLGLQDLDKFTSNKYSENDANKICKDNGNLKDSLDNTYVGDQGDAYKYVTNIAASGASPYVAVGALPTDGTAVVVWYDKNVQALKMKTATFSSVTSTTVSWTDRGIISSVGGKYVSMATDEAGGIHLAYLSNSGANLYYTYMSSVSAKPVTMLVDAYQDVGDRCMITVGRESTSKPWIPYISYKSNYASHTKIAYPVFADDADAATRPTSGIENGTEKYTGAWNVSLVPDTSLSIDDTVSIGVNKDWTSDSGVMYNFPTGETQKASDTGVYALCDATIVYGNGTKNPVMGYAIEDGSIQMAQKK